MAILIEFLEGCEAIQEEFLQKSFPNNGPLKTDAFSKKLSDIIAKNSCNALDRQYKLLDKVKDHSYINKSNRNDVLFTAKKVDKLVLRQQKKWSRLEKNQNKKLNAIPSDWINDHKRKEIYEAAKRLVEYVGNQSTFFKDVSKEMKAIQVTCLNLK